MNHDATHCADCTDECPRECYRAQLHDDLILTNYHWPISMANLKYTNLCPLKQEENKED